MKILGKLLAVVCLALAVCLIADVALPATSGLIPSAQAASKVKLNKSTIRLCVGGDLQAEGFGNEANDHLVQLQQARCQGEQKGPGYGPEGRRGQDYREGREEEIQL